MNSTDGIYVFQRADRITIDHFKKRIAFSEPLYRQRTDKIWAVKQAFYFKLRNQEKLATRLNRLSPAGLFQEVSEMIARTDIFNYERYIQQAALFREAVFNYLDAMNAIRSLRWFTVMEEKDVLPLEEYRKVDYRKPDGSYFTLADYESLGLSDFPRVITLLFILILLNLSFLAFVLSYDAVCGEKEQNTLSSIFPQSVTSAITLLFIWTIMSFVIPATGNLIANQFYPIPKKGEIEKQIRTAQDEIYDTKYRDTKAGSWNGDPFAEWVPLRAQWCTDIMNARNQIYDDYINQMVNQVEKTKWMTRIFPVSVFRYLTEEISGTGVKRFENFFLQANRFKQLLYDFVEEKDSPDEKSPHFLTLPLTTGSAGISRLPVDYASVPQFIEEFPRLKDNLLLIIIDLTILVILGLLFFITGYFLLVRYDKR